jgi:hypothetical protein
MTDMTLDVRASIIIILWNAVVQRQTNEHSCETQTMKSAALKIYHSCVSTDEP